MTTELTWCAIYDDDTELLQKDGVKYSDIDRAMLKQFVIYKEDIPILVLHLDKDKRLIFRRRVAMKVISGKQEVVYLAGWQETRNGVNVQHISFIFEDGHIEVVDGFKEGHPWFYPIQFIPEERL